MSNELLRWRKDASSDEWTKLAALAGTSPGYLDLIAYGFRRASPTKAAAIEKATQQFEAISPVTKESLVFAPPRTTAA
ncbi:antirepressor [Pectobacterium brasiliense]|jgi:DNA-binding transcriptional regulator YdaS (Cro superfamily)|uniref:antirepressor n=1 Tax=Pectobacterium brasiliense TaxID=180957 RepID=UPI00057F0924|nr:antirepressor [Pectobacterium brasiliense]KHS87098.1 antirepressor [Pectobacterium brasiliense]